MRRGLVFALLLAVAACGKTADLSEIKKPGVFTVTDGNLVEIPRLGTLGNTYGPRLYPEIPDYDITAMPDVSPIYVNMPDVPVSTLKGIEWHGYRLGGNASVGSRSTATPQDWKLVAIVSEPTKVPGLFKVVVGTADPKTGRWRPEISHEYFGLTVDGGFKPNPIWAVRIK